MALAVLIDECCIAQWRARISCAQLLSRTERLLEPRLAVEDAWVIFVLAIVVARKPANGRSRATREPDAVLVIRNARSALEIDGLAALVPLNPTQFLTTDQEVQCAVIVQEFSTLAERELIQVAD